MKRFTVEKFFHLLVCSLFFLPLIFWPSVWSPYESPKVFFFLFVIELLLPCYLYLIWKHPERRPSFKHPFLLTLIAFLLFETVAAVFGRDPLNSFFGNSERFDGIFLWYHLFFFYLYLQFSLRSDVRHRKTFIRLFLVVAGITALIGCLQAIGLFPFFGDQFSRRVTSTLGNPIFFASTILIPFFLSFVLCIEEKEKTWKYLYGGIAILCFLALIASQTRGAFVGFVCGGIVGGILWVLKKRASLNKRHVLTISAIIILLIGSFLSARSFSPTNSSLYRITHFSGDNTSSRLAFWGYALKGWRDSPWLGVGYQNYAAVSDKYFESPVYAVDKAWPDKPHNMFLEILVTGGLFAFLCYLALFILAIRSASKQGMFGIAIIAGLVAYMAQNVFAFDVSTTLQNLFILFSLAIVSTHTPQTTKTNSVSPFLWCIGIFPILFWIIYLFPAIYQLHEITAGDDVSYSNRVSGLQHLEQSEQFRFIYDSSLLAATYAKIHRIEVVAANAQTPLGERAFINATRAYDTTFKQHPMRAKYWYLSSVVYYLNAVATSTPVPQVAFDQAKHAQTVAPGRVEPLVALSNIANMNKQPDQAMSLATEAVRLAPTDAESLWTLALLVAKKGDIDKAASLGLAAMQHGLTLLNSDSIQWLVNYYFNKQDFKTVVYIYEASVKIEPNKLSLLPKLAAAYAANGQKEKAIETAQLLLRRAPESKPEVDAFIQSLQ